MNSIWKFFPALLMFCLAVSAEPLKLDWKLCKSATLETREGKQYLRFIVQPEDKDAMNCASAKLNIVPFANSMVEFTIRARAQGVTKPKLPWNGIKFMLNFIDNTGEYWHGIGPLSSTFDWQNIRFAAHIGKPGNKMLLKLGLQESSGEVEFDLSSLQVTKVFSAPTEPYTAVYSDQVRSAPQLRGVMSPVRFKAEDFDTLEKWGVNLVRAQIVNGALLQERNLKKYNSWLDDMLNHYEKMFPIGYQKGIRFVIDLHTPPGGCYSNREMVMFHEKEYADHFIAVWKKIATRFKDNPAVWGYDLINEPDQMGSVPYNYWTLQRRAAEAIREIDPERPIIVESNRMDSPETFHYLAPFKLKNIIYQVHMYKPSGYTHQRVKIPGGKLNPGEKPIYYPGMVSGTYFDKKELKRALQPVRDFQKKYGARIYVGEFSAVTWAPGAAQYLRDCIEIFEEYGWDWTYHAFRESSIWDVEKAGTHRGDIKPTADTDRKQVLLEGFQKNKVK